MGNNVLQKLLHYAEDDDNICAVLAEGSRAFGTVDDYSDYDIVYVTRSNKPYFNGAILPFLVDCFGEIAIMQTPDDGDPEFVYTHLIQFKNGIRIDLTFNSIEFLSRTPLESATGVLLDKDDRFSNIEQPSDSDFWQMQPSAEKFRRLCNEFWWCSPYVVKAVARNQMLHALEMLTHIRNEYVTMLAILAGANNNRKCVNTGKHHFDVNRFLLPEQKHYYDVLLESYVQADNLSIITALSLLMENYNALATDVADLLGYCYDFTEMEKCTGFIKERYSSIWQVS